MASGRRAPSGGGWPVPELENLEPKNGDCEEMNDEKIAPRALLRNKHQI